jgi:hypothetical protein
MVFRGSPGDMTALLVIALAVVAVIFMLRKKYDSNLPLLFYLVAMIFSNMSDKSVNPYLMYAGLAFTLLLRFEYMGKAFTKVVAFFATTSICLIIWVFLVDVFGEGLAPF